MPLAFFITFTTYGTWLPGSAKGQGSVDLEHNQHGTPFLAPNGIRENTAKARMKQPEFVLSGAEREIAGRAMIEPAGERGWHLLALHVRSNHTHVVIQAEKPVARVMSDLKARASKALTLAGYGEQDRRRWTRHGSTRYLFDLIHVATAIDYTLNQQGEPMFWYRHKDLGLKDLEPPG